MDNISEEAWGSSSANKGNDGVSATPLYIFLWYFYIRLAKKLEKQAKLVLKFPLKYAFDSSNTKLKWLVILVIILIFGFGPQGPMRLM